MGGPVGDLLDTVLSPFGLGKPDMPKLPETPVAPVPDSLEAKKRAVIDLQRKYATAGRAGTVLSDNSKLG